MHWNHLGNDPGNHLSKEGGFGRRGGVVSCRNVRVLRVQDVHPTTLPPLSSVRMKTENQGLEYIKSTHPCVVNKCPVTKCRMDVGSPVTGLGASHSRDCPWHPFGNYSVKIVRSTKTHDTIYHPGTPEISFGQIPRLESFLEALLEF